jgi:8-oxo-dGTP pyrophosphatase MutT (NUDIX family)
MVRSFRDKFAIILYRAYTPVLKIYWWLFRPYTFGVRLLIYHRDFPDTVLLIRHTYGNTQAWNMPGGGYKPSQEKDEAAARREAFEEVGIECGTLKFLGEQKSGREHKRDTVTFYSCVASSLEITLQSEIAEARWFPVSEIRNIKRAPSLDFILTEKLC